MSPRFDGEFSSEHGPSSNRHKSTTGPKEVPLRLADLPSQYVSIDPGSVHCGVARWEVTQAHIDPTTGLGSDLTTVRLIEAYERTPGALYIELRELQQDGIGLVICEDFQVQKGRTQAGSRLPTIKVIGVIEYICTQAGLWCKLQSPGIKTYVDAWLMARVPATRGGNIDINSLASNTHKRDSIRHGLYPTLREKIDADRVRLVLDEHSRGRG